jgi:hypothetical protein
MAQSKFSKNFMRRQIVANATGVAGQTVRIPLNRDNLIAEHTVHFGVNEVFAGAGAVLPTSVDPRDFIATVAVESSDGRRVFLTGAQWYDFGRLTENTGLVSSAIGASPVTASWNCDLHYENDEALLDLATALRSNELTTLDLVVTFAADVGNGFKGGTIGATAAATTYTVEVETFDYEMLNEEQHGMALGMFAHYQEKQEDAAAVVGAQREFQLITGNRTRFISLHTYNTTGAVPVLSDTVIGNIRINIGGKDKVKSTWMDTRRVNAMQRGFNNVGVVVLDFGDDERGWMDVDKVAQAKLQVDILGTAPAGWSIKVGQDYTKERH